MLRLLRSRSPVLRTLLVLALLAWAALPFDSYAHSVALAADSSAGAPMAMGTGSTAHCDGMSMEHGSNTSHTSHPAPSHPSHDGHGCCTGHNCYCMSVFSGMAGLPYFCVTCQPTRSLVLIPIHVAPTLTRAAPPLRPPIS